MSLNTLAKTAIAGLIGSVALAAAAPAEAHGWHRGGGDDAAVAVGAGILGLAVGAAIASDSPRYYYDDYYAGPAYYPAYPAYGYYNSYPVYRAPRYYYNGYRQYRGYNGYRDYDRGYNHGYRHEGHRGHW
jgi:hypothetical protein